VQSIVRSELRVLKTLQYRLMISTPLVYVEALLAVLGAMLFSLLIAPRGPLGCTNRPDPSPGGNRGFRLAR